MQPWFDLFYTLIFAVPIVCLSIKISTVPLRGVWLFFSFAILNALVKWGMTPNIHAAALIKVAALICITIFAVQNRTLCPRGFLCLLIGVYSNAAVRMANKMRMPATAPLQFIEKFPSYTLMTTKTHLNMLGDWINLPASMSWYSPGDMFIIAGLAICFLELSIRKQPR